MPLKIVRNDIIRMRVRSLYPDLEAYIDRHYVEEKEAEEYDGLFEYHRRKGFAVTSGSFGAADATETAKLPEKRTAKRKERDICLKAPKLFSKASAPMEDAAPAPNAADYDAFIEESEAALKERLIHLSDTFQEYLFYLIEAKGLTNADVYKRALLTKQLFSKIKLNPEYHPDKATAMRLCIGAKLNLDETKDLLARAGYALSPCEKRDVIFSYFIEKGVYDMIEIDIALEEHGAECFID